MKLGPLTLFKRMHGNGKPADTILVAALHWRWSITWRWSIVWRPSIGRFAFHAHRTHRGYPNSPVNFSAFLCAPLIGGLNISTQPNMRRK